MKLKPCPFCGCKCQTKSTSNAIAGNTLHVVLCVCGSEGPTGDTEKEAAANWNRRAPATKARAEA